MQKKALASDQQKRNSSYLIKNCMTFTSFTFEIALSIFNLNIFPKHLENATVDRQISQLHFSEKWMWPLVLGVHTQQSPSPLPQRTGFFSRTNLQNAELSPSLRFVTPYPGEKPLTHHYVKYFIHLMYKSNVMNRPALFVPFVMLSG